MCTKCVCLSNTPSTVWIHGAHRQREQEECVYTHCLALFAVLSAWIACKRCFAARKPDESWHSILTGRGGRTSEYTRNPTWGPSLTAKLSMLLLVWQFSDSFYASVRHACTHALMHAYMHANTVCACSCIPLHAWHCVPVQLCVLECVWLCACMVAVLKEPRQAAACMHFRASPNFKKGEWCCCYAEFHIYV